MLQSARNCALMRLMRLRAAQVRPTASLRVRGDLSVESVLIRRLPMSTRKSNGAMLANDTLTGRWCPAALLHLVCVLATASAHAQALADPSLCIREAQEISGYHGQERTSALGGALKGGLGGAAVGAAGGWVTGGDSGKAAKRGAALGAVIGTVKAASANKDLDRKRETYERPLQACQARQSSNQP